MANVDRKHKAAMRHLKEVSDSLQEDERTTWIGQLYQKLVEELDAAYRTAKLIEESRGAPRPPVIIKP